MMKKPKNNDGNKPEAKAIITIDAEDPDQIQFIEDWFERWRPDLSYISGNEGCGCCVDSWTVHGPMAAIEEILDRDLGVIEGSEYSWIRRKLNRLSVILAMRRQKRDGII